MTPIIICCGKAEHHMNNYTVGETITWTWGGGTHNLRTTGGVEMFDSGYSSTYGFTFSHTFTVVGTTTYVCDPHESHMYGIVTVIE